MEGRFEYCAVCGSHMPDAPTRNFLCERHLAKNQGANRSADARAPRFIHCAVCGGEMPDAPTTNYVHEAHLARNQPEVRN